MQQAVSITEPDYGVIFDETFLDDDADAGMPAFKVNISKGHDVAHRRAPQEFRTCRPARHNRGLVARQGTRRGRAETRRRRSAHRCGRGRRAAQLIGDSELLVIPGTDYDLPQPVWPVLADALRALADLAELGETPTPRPRT